MSVILPFPKPPTRAIYVRQLPRSRQWIATFDGDPWRARFTTETGAKWLVLDAVTERRFRAGLPIVVVELPRARRKAGGGA